MGLLYGRHGRAGRLTAKNGGFRQELRGHGVAVVSLWPGLVRTEVNESMPKLDAAMARGRAGCAANPWVIVAVGGLHMNENAARLNGSTGCGS
jgi:short-subunit dehydrogenase